MRRTSGHGRTKCPGTAGPQRHIYLSRGPCPATGAGSGVRRLGGDLNYKMHLYAAAGISEYLIYDLGVKRWSRSPRELLMYRLEGGAYRQAPIADEYWSEVFGTHVRFQPDARENDEEFRGVPEEERSPPRFQWWDPDTERWRDRETDAEVEREEERKRHARALQETRVAGEAVWPSP